MITGFFGLPGSGKTTFLAMLAQRELRRIKKGKSKYKHVATNFYCDGCINLNYENLGKYNIEDTLVLLDEITLDADSRDFKQFGKEKKQFFLLHRHFGCDVIYFTQQYDNVDKKVRDVTQYLYFVRASRVFPFLSVAKQIYRCLDINEQTREIVSGYRFANWFESIFCKTRKYCIRPLWYRYFDSWERPRLPDWHPRYWQRMDSTPGAGAGAPVEKRR